jgi:hypothetical protein
MFCAAFPAAGDEVAPAGSASSVVTIWFADEAGVVAVGLAVAWAPLTLELVLASPLPDLANCDE